MERERTHERSPQACGRDQRRVQYPPGNGRDADDAEGPPVEGRARDEEVLLLHLGGHAEQDGAVGEEDGSFRRNVGRGEGLRADRLAISPSPRRARA